MIAGAGTARCSLLVTGHEDPMWPFLRAACSGAELDRMVPFFTDLPDRFSCTYHPGGGTAELDADGRRLSEEDIASVWWRAVVPPLFDAPNGQLVDYCTRELVSFYEGLEPILKRSLWVSRPSAIESARNKPRQLELAKELGFRVLDTAVTNSPSEARRRAAERATVFKSIRSPRIPVDSGSHHTVFTTLLSGEALDGVEGIVSCPGILQEFLDKAGDVRVTVIGTEVFGVFIDSQAARASSVDFRLGARDLSYRAFDVSSGDAGRCRAMLSALGLQYGAFDFGLTRAGEMVFFEVNPNGQWGWLEQATGLPMRRALVELLLEQAGEMRYSEGANM